MINKTYLPLQKKRSKDEFVPKSSFEIAKEFAKSIPKPSPRRKESPTLSPTQEPDPPRESELELLEMRHA